VFSAFSLDSGNKKNPLAPDFSMSAGGRIFYNGMFDSFSYSYSHSSQYGDPLAGFNENFYNNHGFGIGGFFDATYLEIGMDLIFGSFKPNARGYSGDFEMKSTHFGFSLLAKYPFTLGQVMFFPLVGIDYQIFVSGEAYGHTVSHDDYDDWFDAFSIAAGVGLDYNLGSKLYLRGGLLANFKLDGERESELKNYAKNNDVTLSLFMWGLRGSIGVGYKF
jgi:hypothetical protein